MRNIRVKIHLRPPPGVKIDVIEDESGEVVDVVVTPDFHTSRAAPSFFHGTSETEAGLVKDRFVLFASGVSANVSMRKRNDSVKPLVDMTAEELAQVSQGNSPGDDDDDSDASPA